MPFSSNRLLCNSQSVRWILFSKLPVISLLYHRNTLGINDCNPSTVCRRIKIQNLHQNCSEGPLVSIKIFYNALIMENEYDCNDQNEELSSHPPCVNHHGQCLSWKKKAVVQPYLLSFLSVNFSLSWGVLLLPEVITGSEFYTTVHRYYKQLHCSTSCLGLSL